MSKLDFLNFEVKAVPEEEGVFEGYASTWERDLIDDEITKGAYAETLSADYPDGGAGIPLYWGRFNSRKNVVFPVPAFPVRNTFTPVYSKKSYANSSCGLLSMDQKFTRIIISFGLRRHSIFTKV